MLNQRVKFEMDRALRKHIETALYVAENDSSLGPKKISQ